MVRDGIGFTRIYGREPRYMLGAQRMCRQGDMGMGR